MGIPGLTTFIRNQSDRYMENFQLHDTLVVIDGNGLSSQLYTACGSYCSFGGDYDKFQQTTREFFEELAQCNVTPLVLIDGGTEEKKLRTVIERLCERIRMTSSYCISSENSRSVIFPTLIKESFKATLDAINVKWAQSTFEADSDIAAVAKALGCPVMSLDSDFYIYDAPYIPVSTLENGVTRKPEGKGYMKRCKIYKVDRLLQSHHGLDRSVLPLLAALLGNDYVSAREFSRFFNYLKLPIRSRRLYNDQQRRIDALLNWLKNHSLDSAITAVLGRMQQSERAKVLRSIELVVNSYNVLSPGILLALGYEKQFVDDVTLSIKRNPYEYSRRQIVIEEAGLSRKDKIINEVDEESIRQVAPRWFMDEFNMGKFPACYMDYLTRQMYLVSVQVENIQYPSTGLIILPILRVTYKLLTSGVLLDDKPLTYLVRNTGQGYQKKRLECPESICGDNFPSLHRLRDIPTRNMMNETLGIIPEMKIEEVVDSWQLYVATMVFWMTQDVEPPRNYAHIQTLLFSMLFSIVDSKIGFYRKQHVFSKAYGERVRAIEEEKKNEGRREMPMNVSLQQAIEEVTENDCLMAAPFFIGNFDMDEYLRRNVKKFNITIVHVFGMFQACLKHVMHLNALLGYPYQQPAFNSLYNGTFLYNVYVNFKKRNNIEEYMKHVLQNSPSLLRVALILVEKARQMCNAVNVKIESENRKKQNKKKSRVWKDAEDTLPSEDEEKVETKISNPCYMGNNKFSILSPMD